MLWATFLSHQVYVYIFNHFYAVRPKATKFAEITQNNGL